jgi:hypothetical protein
MEEAKKFQQEFSNLRLMMTRMSKNLSRVTGYDPALGKDQEVRKGGPPGAVLRTTFCSSSRTRSLAGCHRPRAA